MDRPLNVFFRSHKTVQASTLGMMRHASRLSLRFLTLLISCLLVSIIVKTQICSADDALPGVDIVFEADQQHVFVSYSASLTGAPHSSTPLISRLYLAPNNRDGCGPVASLKPPANHKQQQDWTIVLLRGGKCTFGEKLKKAQTAGASAAIIVNTVSGLYNQTSRELMNSCSLNCDLGYSRESEQECQAESSCYTCAENINLGSREFCCVHDGLIDMYVGKSAIEIPAFFASIEDGDRFLVPRAQSRENVRIFHRDTYAVDPSLFVIGSLGCIVLIAASYRAVSKERSIARWIWSPRGLQQARTSASDEIHEDHDHEQMHLSVSDAGWFVCGSTCTIVLLFAMIQYYPHAVVRVLQFLFALGSMQALAKLVIVPCLSKAFTRYDRPCRLPVWGESTTTVKLAGNLLAALVAFTWLFQRHAPWAWLLLDLLAASVATSFLLTLRLPSLRVGTALLCAFFVYDVFMVFVTPSIFAGKSIMVDVATAGRAREQADALKCARQQEETVPMLFSVPRSDWYGGYALLGLGDVVLPGLLVVLALRFDYAKLRHSYSMIEPLPRPPSFVQVHAYWIPLIVSYSAGLALTFVANVRGWTFNGVRGQPALLYLVPSCLGCFFFLIWKRGDYAAVWTDAWLDWEDEGTKQREDEEAHRDEDADYEAHQRIASTSL